MSTKIKQLFKDLSEENAVELRDILADGSWGHTAVADWIKGMGYSISEAGVRRWRNEHGWTKSTPMAAVETEDGEPYIQRQTREVGEYRQFDNDDQPMHFIIPDTQIEPGDPTDMMRWAGQYLVDHFGAHPHVRVIHLGDHAAMRSLSHHNSNQEAEGLLYMDDVNAANDAWHEFNNPIALEEAKGWSIKKIMCLGNHEEQITRYVGENPRLRGTMSTDDLAYAETGWDVVPFLEVIKVDGIYYTHYFVNNANGRAVSGMTETRIKSIGVPFVQGHQQGLKTGMVETVAGRRRGIVAGSCYLKSEGYRGPQAAGEWRGVLALHQVRDGDYDLMEVSLSYLCQKYEGMGIAQFMMEKYGLKWLA